MNFEAFVSPLVALYHDPVFFYIIQLSNAIALICWILSIVTNNLSQVDRIWPVLPPVFSWIFIYTAISYHPDVCVERLALVSAVMTLWCVRLVYNYWRKGGYYGQHEDYRWVHVRAMFGYPERKVIYHIFNFAFTAFFQIFLLMSLALPLWHIQNNPKQEPLNVMDGVVFAGLVAFLTLEIVADQQQWNYQTNKYKWLGQGKAAQTRSTSGGLSYTSEEIEDFKRGFHIKGLFRYTRHPNFFAEISIWWTVYLFSLSAQFSHLRANFAWSALVNYSIVGAVFLNLLFLGSTHLTEKITLSKYPEYAKYQKRVSSLIPFITTYEPNKSK